MPAPFNHSSGLPGVYDRSADFPNWQRVLFREDKLAQAAELMEAQSIIERRNRRVAERVMSDGDRIQGADAVVAANAGTVTLSAGLIYARGDVRPVAAATLANVPMTGEVSVGIRIVTAVVTEEQETALLGLHPGTEAEGEAGAGRESETTAWGFSGDGEDCDLYQVYLLKDGVIVDQTPPPSLSGVNQAIALYDRDAHGSYIVNGCKVQALGLIGGAQHFSIGEGVANILGFKRSRAYSVRHTEPEAFDTATVDAEPQIFADGGTGTATITVNRGPIASMIAAIITKQNTVTMTKGAANTSDLLPDDSVTAIVSVVQGGTTYVQGTSYTLSADSVNWSRAGPEPATGSTYSVTYRYLDATTPASVGADTVVLSGGVTGTAVLLSYTWKLPRVDLLCLNSNGLPVYVKGVSSVASPRAPSDPVELLPLAQIVNNWRGTPTVINTDVRSVPYVELWAYIRRLFDVMDLIALERLRRDIDSREPVAKKGVFVDPWETDFYRDQGLSQTAAIFGGQMQLAISPTVTDIGPSAATMLDYTHEVVVRQELATGCMKINPYQNFEPLPASLQIVPSVDFWTDRQTQWASAVTQDIGNGDQIVWSETQTVLVNERTQVLENLRQISVAFTVRGFGPGEILVALTFDGLNVLPGGPPLVANSSGVVTGTFTIPANVPAGTKVVVATGGSGATASAQFVGQGRVDISVLRQVTTITRGGNRGGNDPLAQTFTLTEARHISGVDVKFCAIGDRTKDVLIEIHPVENGWPTTEIIVQKTVPMGSVVQGAWTSVRFDVPVFLTADREWCIMVKTDDANHALSIGEIGEFDAVAQRWAGAQPYSVGVLLSSSNALTWTPHQTSDLTFRLTAAKFAPDEKVVNLGAVNVTDMSDLLIRAGVELPTAHAAMFFEVERASGEVTRMLPNQSWRLTEFVTETVEVRAVLHGSEKISPTLFPNVAFIAGKLAATGTYVTRAFSMGSAIRMSAFVKSILPAGATLTVEIDGDNGTWTTVTQFAATVIDGGWTEREYRVTPYTATAGRIRLTLSGSPSARPVLSDFRAISI